MATSVSRRQLLSKASGHEPILQAVCASTVPGSRYECMSGVLEHMIIVPVAAIVKIISWQGRYGRGVPVCNAITRIAT